MRFFSNKSIQQNAFRISAMLFALCALIANALSISKEETMKKHPIFNFAAFMVTVVAANHVSARINDHWGHREKKLNIVAGFYVISMLIIEMGFYTATVVSPFEQPIALPGLIGVFEQIGMAGINWQRSETPIRTNIGRMFSLAGAASTFGLCTSSIILNNQQLFSGANLSSNCSNLSEILARFYDIFITHKDETTRVNKICMGGFVLFVFGNTISNSLAATGVTKLPLAFSSMMMCLASWLYMIGQWRTQTNNDAPNATPDQPLLSPTQEEDHSQACCFCSVENVPFSPATLEFATHAAPILIIR